jgi:hypothetical protein
MQKHLIYIHCQLKANYILSKTHLNEEVSFYVKMFVLPSYSPKENKANKFCTVSYKPIIKKYNINSSLSSTCKMYAITQCLHFKDVS